jgi:hypothetical protein
MNEMLVSLDQAPASVQKALDRLYRRLGVRDVVVVPVRPEPDAEFDEGFAAVAKKVTRDGGKPAYYKWRWMDTYAPFRPIRHDNQRIKRLRMNER